MLRMRLCWCWGRAPYPPAPTFASSIAPACDSLSIHSHINISSCDVTHKTGAACTLHPVYAIKCTQARPLLSVDAFSGHTRPSASPREACIAWILQAPHPDLSISVAPLQVDPRLFFKPVQFHVKLPNLGVQPVRVTLGIDRFRPALPFK